MPKVYEITARFYREKQPVQYEKAGAELVVKALLGDDEYKNGDAVKLLSEVQSVVLNSLGLGVEAASSVQQPAAASQVEGPKTTPKPKAKVEKPAAAPAQAPSTAADAADMSGGPASETPAATKGIPDEDLQKTASAAAQRLGSSEKVKALMKEFGVARLGELPQDKRPAFIDKVDALKKE